MIRFQLDKHNQLRIKSGTDIKAEVGEPDLLVLSQEQTEELADVIFAGAADGKIVVPSCKVSTLTTKQRRQ